MKIDELSKLTATITQEDREELLLFARLLKSVPEFGEKLRAMAAPGELIPPLEVTEALMEEYKGRLPA